MMTVLALMVFGGASQLAYAQGLAYVANFGSNSVSVIDTSSNTVVATVTVGSQPTAVAITPDGTRVYVANCGGDVSVIDTSSNTVATKVTVGSCPYDVAITPDGTRAYVVRDNGASVWAIDTSTNTVAAKVTVAATPGAVAITPDGTRAYVISAGTGNLTVSPVVSVLDTSSNNVVTTLSVGGIGTAPVGVAITPDGKYAYVPNAGGYVSVIDTSSNAVTAKVSVAGIGSSQVGVAITPDGTRVFVVTYGANGTGPVAVIDTASNTVVANVHVGTGPTGVAISPDGTLAYVTIATNVTGLGNGAVSVIDTSSKAVVATVPVGSTPSGVAFKAGGGGLAGYTCTNTTPPAITFVDSASAYGGYSYFSSGSWLEIKGTNLADPADPRLTAATNPGQWTSGDFTNGNAPTSLDGISVSINGKPAYVWYLSTGQLNVQAPEDSATGNVAITVTNCKATSPMFTFSRRSLAPGFLAPSNYAANGTPYMVAFFDSDHAYVLNTSTATSFGVTGRPAKPGDQIYTYGIGFGDVTPSTLPGVIAQQAVALVNAVTISFGTTPATISYQGLTPGSVGLYQFNFTVPSTLANGDYQIEATQNGTAVPQTMYLTVHS